MNKQLMLILVFGLVCKAGYEKDKSSEVCVEVAPTVLPSDELPPHDAMPANIHAIDIESWATADSHHPATCAVHCVWSGANCICNQDTAAGKKP